MKVVVVVWRSRMWIAKVSGRNVPRHIGPGIVVGVNLVLDAKGLDLGDVVCLLT